MKIKSFVRRIVLALFFGLVVVGAQAPLNSAQAQCPMCKINVKASMNNPETAKGRGLNNGILYLLVMPYLLIGGVIFFVARGYHKRKKLRALAPPLG